jgi:carboxymethylenebutenolidase
MSGPNPRQNVTFPSNGGEAHGYLAVATSGGPGVIVIQEWWGLDEHIADIVDRLAAEGFVALAPDLYGGAVAHDAAEAGELAGKLPVEQAVIDLGGAVDFLLGHEAVTSSTVGAIGFCMGGGFVLGLAAAQGDKIGAAVPFYGVGPGVPDSYRGVTAPIQGHYAEQDRFFPVEQARRLEQQLAAETSADVEFFYYPAGHAFLNDRDKLGTYDRGCAEAAWERAVGFLTANVR